MTIAASRRPATERDDGTPEPTKVCTRCGEAKPSDDFHRQTASPDGLQPWCKACAKVARRAWDAANPERRRSHFRRHDLKRDFGLTLEQYAARLAEQCGVCAICGQAETATYHGALRSLAVDHDHRTGEIRALLCSNCNRGLGCFRDDAAALRAAADYLDRFSEGR